MFCKEKICINVHLENCKERYFLQTMDFNLIYVYILLYRGTNTDTVSQDPPLNLEFPTNDIHEDKVLEYYVLLIHIVNIIFRDKHL